MLIVKAEFQIKKKLSSKRFTMNDPAIYARWKETREFANSLIKQYIICKSFSLVLKTLKRVKANFQFLYFISYIFILYISYILFLIYLFLIFLYFIFYLYLILYFIFYFMFYHRNRNIKCFISPKDKYLKKVLEIFDQEHV